MKIFAVALLMLWVAGMIVSFLPISHASNIAYLLWAVPAGWGAGQAINILREHSYR